jgi:type I restriction enzyme, S subunit
MTFSSILLKDLLLFTRDGEWGQAEPQDGFVEMRVVRGTDFEAARYGDFSETPVRHIAQRFAEYKKLQPNDIIIETAGGSPGKPTGRTLFFKQHFIDESSLPFACASFCRFLRVNPCIAEPEYVYWYLQYLYNSGYIGTYQVQHTGVARFQYTTFAESTEIRLPPLSEQHTIAAILGSLDDKIDLNRRMNATLEAIARAIFKSWFVDFDPVHAKARGEQPYGMDADTAILFPDLFEESPLGLIPSDWYAGTLGDIAENKRRSVQPEQLIFDTPYIGLANMPQRSIALPEWGMAEEAESNKYAFYAGEFLFGKLRPYFHKVGIAPIDGVCSTDILVVVPRSPEWYGLTLATISDQAFVQYTTSLSAGTKMPRTNWHDMARYQIAIPPSQVAEAYNNIVIPMFEMIQSNVHESHTLVELRDTLLPKLLSGELRITDAELLI